MKNVAGRVVLAWLLIGCGSSSAGPDVPPAPGAEVPPPPGTPQDNAKPPPVDGTPIVGVFVSASLGNDSSSGSSTSPVKTLQRAFALAKEQQIRVIACAETYPENLELLDGVSAYGYYDCKKEPWARVSAKAVVAAPASPAVVARGLKLPTRIEGFELRAPDLDGAPATDAAGTSIALEVRDTSNLVFAESLLHGGKGAPGQDGTDAPVNPRTNATSDGTAGADQTSRTCPQPLIPLPVCQFSRTVPGRPGGATTCAIAPNGGAGGAGGDPRWYSGATESSGSPYELRGRPTTATPATAAGGANTNPNGFGFGTNGANGSAGADGPDGANGTWALSAAGFVRGNGTAGGGAEPGQGGGGGGSPRGFFDANGVESSVPTNTYWNTAAGGGGGGGGCAGQAGTPATGGGASIGAFVVGSTLTFERVRIESAGGGRAGKGNLGSAGTAGGGGGAAVAHGAAVIAGAGGSGGSGGSGGASGHGAPGPSIALAYASERPTLNETELAPGPAGAGQPELRRAAQVLPAVTGASLAESKIP